MSLLFPGSNSDAKIKQKKKKKIWFSELVWISFQTISIMQVSVFPGEKNKTENNKPIFQSLSIRSLDRHESVASVALSIGPNNCIGAFLL